MTRDQLIQAVALRMDEITPSGALDNITVDGSDNNPLYELIDGLIDGGVLELFSVAPFWRLPQTTFSYNSTAANNQIIVEALPSVLGLVTHNANGDTVAETRYIIRLKVPEDFLRVAEISCDAFLRPITEVFPEQSEQGKRQHNRFLIARESRPVGIISHGVWNSAQCREIDCYSLTSTIATADINTKVHASYIAKPPVIKDTATVVTVEDALGGSVLIPALEWLIAARTFGARGDANHAAICQQNAQNLLV